MVYLIDLMHHLHGPMEKFISSKVPAIGDFRKSVNWMMDTLKICEKDLPEFQQTSMLHLCGAKTTKFTFSKGHNIGSWIQVKTHPYLTHIQEKLGKKLSSESLFYYCLPNAWEDFPKSTRKSSINYQSHYYGYWVPHIRCLEKPQ